MYKYSESKDQNFGKKGILTSSIVIVFVIAVDALKEESSSVVVQHHVEVHRNPVHLDVDLWTAWRSFTRTPISVSRVWILLEFTEVDERQ